MKKTVYVILIVVLIGVFGYSAYRLGDYYMAKYKSDKCTAQAAQHVHVVEKPNLYGPQKEDEPKTEPDHLEVDFDALWKLNKDIVAWIYCPGTPINYPVVQSEDNDYYLRRLLDGTWNIGGTLFLDYRCSADFSGINSIIYGHHMKSGTMFGSLVRYRNQSYYNEHPVVFLVTPYGQYRVELFAGCTIDAMDGIYEPNPSPEQVERLKQQSTFVPSADTATEGPILTLSTCAHDFENARYVVLGRLVPIEPAE